MELSDFNNGEPSTKSWLNPVCGNVFCQSVECDDLITARIITPLIKTQLIQIPGGNDSKNEPVYVNNNFGSMEKITTNQTITPGPQNTYFSIKGSFIGNGIPINSVGNTYHLTYAYNTMFNSTATLITQLTLSNVSVIVGIEEKNLGANISYDALIDVKLIPYINTVNSISFMYFATTQYFIQNLGGARSSSNSGLVTVPNIFNERVDIDIKIKTDQVSGYGIFRRYYSLNRIN